MPLHDKLMLFSIAFGLSAIIYGVAAALTKIHNERPTLISDLRRQNSSRKRRRGMLRAVEYPFSDPVCCEVKVQKRGGLT